ncbi:MAG: InlB B-repeat-containing protein [Chitinispirillales bacterium]|jgi:uncharacterized repeat protein (TIGR02543 family)|nr:InlB B-repeat-containing protein [Chitinispirillales bacterium]
MIKEQKIRLLVALLLLVMGGGEQVFGQGSACIPGGQNQLLLPVGNDHRNPRLDPFLMQHSLYADEYMASSETDLTMPNAGYAGTAGKVEYANLKFPPVSSMVTENCGVKDTAKVFIRQLGPGANIWGTRPPLPFFVEGSDAYANGKPKFPDIRDESGFWDDIIASNKIKYNFENNLGKAYVVNGTETWEPGIYYYYNLTLGVNSVLNIKVSDEPTVIYIKEDLRGPSNSVTYVNVIPEKGGQACEAKGKVIFIVQGCVMFTQTQTIAQGTYIALGGINLNQQANIKGQVLGNRFRTNQAFDATKNITFVPALNDVFVSPAIFKEDKNWNNYPNSDKPTYNGYDYKRDKNKDYIDSIRIELKNPAQKDMMVNYKIKAIAGNDIIGELGINITPSTIDDAFARRNEGKRAWVQLRSNAVLIKKGEKAASIPILIVDDGKEQSFDKGTFEITVSGEIDVTDPCGGAGCQTIKKPFSDTYKITIVSDDPEDEDNPDPEVFTITFDSQGGTAAQSIYGEEGAVTLLPNTKKDGYVFLGWFSESVGGNNYGSNGTTYTITGNVTMYARWDEIIIPQPGTPTLTQVRLIEWYDYQSNPQVAGTLSADDDNATFEYLGAFEAESGVSHDDWFKLTDFRKISTTAQYHADYENKNQQRFRITVKASLGEKSETRDLDLYISPWNDNAFEPKDYSASVKSPELHIITLETPADADLPSNQNEYKILGLTKNASDAISQAQRLKPTDTRPVRVESIRTLSGAEVSLYGKEIAYKPTNLYDDVKTGAIDRFWVTLLDTARYIDHAGVTYETDIWLKSVEVNITLTVPVNIQKSLKIYPNPLTLPKGGKGQVEEQLKFDMATYYKISPATKGSIIVLDLKGAILPDEQPFVKRNVVKIFDKVGNLISEMDMKFDYDSGKNVAGICIWDGKNSNGRTVGVGSYKVIVDVEADFGNGKQKYSDHSTIGVKY